jgi:DNA-binding NarL/FixJ family response regulator
MIIHIVDDSPNMRQTIRSVLGPVRAEFIESADGDDAVKLFTARRPDVVIMDIRMGRTDGIEAARALRAVSPAARIIIVTQYDDEDLRQEARDAGVLAYVLKDDLTELPSIIRSL